MPELLRGSLVAEVVAVRGVVRQWPRPSHCPRGAHAAVQARPEPQHTPACAPQVDPAGSNLTLAVLCAYDCSRIYAGNTLQAYNGSTFYLGTTGVLASNVVPNPLAAGATSATIPTSNLGTSVYINVTVSCWPAGFSGLVKLGPPCPVRRDTAPGMQAMGILAIHVHAAPATPARAAGPEERLCAVTAWPFGGRQQRAMSWAVHTRHVWQAEANNPLRPCPYHLHYMMQHSMHAPWAALCMSTCRDLHCA